MHLPVSPLISSMGIEQGRQPATKDNAIYSYAVRWSKPQSKAGPVNAKGESQLRRDLAAPENRNVAE
jgi:hypothetical protein